MGYGMGYDTGYGMVSDSCLDDLARDALCLLLSHPTLAAPVVLVLLVVILNVRLIDLDPPSRVNPDQHSDEDLGWENII